MKRLHSLDVLRGFDMFWIMGGAGLATIVASLFNADAGRWVGEQMEHPNWIGLHFIDFVFPTFIFIAGVSFPYSLARQTEAGRSRADILLRIARRFLVLFALGLVYNGFLRHGPSDVVWGSVLSRIAVAWAGAAVLYVFCSLRTRIAVAVCLLLGYWALFLAVGAPDHPEAGHFTMEGCIAGWVDRMVLPGKLTHPGVLSSQGLLSSFPAVVTGMLGMFAGEYVRGSTASGERKSLTMLAGALGLLALGLLVTFGFGAWSFPCIKKLWSPSYVLFCGSYSLAAFALFYWLVDVKCWWRHTLFFKVIGMNSITIYLAQAVVGFDGCTAKLFTWFSTLVPAALAPLVMSAGYVAVCWILLYFLYRRQIFLKV